MTPDKSPETFSNSVNTLNVGSGNDQFGFEANNGLDTIYDFETGIDTIQLISLGYPDFNELDIRSNQDGDAQMNLSRGHVTLRGIVISSLHQADVDFIA